MEIDRFFSGEDLAAIERRVREAERATGGEVVVYAVDASDDYPEAAWTAAAAGAALLPLAAAAAHRAAGFWGGAGQGRWADHWTGHWLLWIVLPALLGAALGWLAAALLPGLRRRLVREADLARRTERRAAAAFVSEEVFATRDRTGVLLFVSLFEHRVVVLADAGIHARVPPGSWDAVVEGVVAGIRAGRPGAAVAEGVERCGRLLAEHGVPRRPDDRDELADPVRREER